MNFPIITTQSAYWLLLIIGIAGSLTYFIYYKNLLASGLSKSKTIFLSSLRFLLLIFIGFLLLGPVIKIITNETKKPIIVFAQDNSMSMVLSKDSTFLRDTFPQITKEIFNKLSSKYDIRTIQFGDTVSDINNTFTDKETDFEELINEFNTTYFNQNIGALIVASDGLFNTGVNPLYASQNLSFPIYTIPFGDTILHIDLAVKKIDYNKVAYKGTKFPIVVGVSADFLKGQEINIEIISDGNIVQSQLIKVDNNTFFKKVYFYIKADTSGVFKYVVKSSSDNINETNTINNTKNIYVEVEENKRKILLLQDGYHPDVAVFKQIIDVNPAFEIEIYNPREFKGNVNDYSLVILHQLPSNLNSLQSILPDLLKYNIPMLFVVGKHTSLDAINNLSLVLNINQQNGLFDDVLPKLNTEFTLFSMSIDDNMMIDMPPLVAPFGSYKSLSQNNVLLFQKVGVVETQKPLWTFVESGKQKIAFIMGEGLWKWRLQEYKKYRDHSITNELVTKTIHYLALKNRVTPFVLDFKHIVDENEEVFVKAKLFNASNELVNNASINIDVFDSGNNKYQYVCKEMPREYVANFGSLPKGKYRFTASTKLGDKSFVKSGTFIVTENLIEQSNLLADYNVLHRLSVNSGGEQFGSNQFSQLIKEIENNTNITSIIYSTKNIQELINIRWLFIILLLIVAVEWFFRKYWGVV